MTDHHFPEKFIKLSEVFSNNDFFHLKQVGLFAFQHLSHIRRSSGKSYAQHGIQVALTLSELTKDVSLLKVAILHDIFLHPQVHKVLKKAPLTDDEKNLARRMHELRRLFINSRTQDLDRFINAFIEEKRLLPLRMAHRMSDIRELDAFDIRARKQIAKETLDMYTAIAGRVGMHVWRQEMEDICFKVVHPSIAKRIELQCEENRLLDEKCLNDTQVFLQEKLVQNGVRCRIEKRIKGLYSTYRKMLVKHRSFSELTDRLALRVIVDDPVDCYKALGILHHYMHPIPGKLKDYIGAPKENGYQSIHTVVYPLLGVTEQSIEVQIRTAFMNEMCQYGSAAHGEYKKNQYIMTSNSVRVNLFKNIAQLRREVKNPKQFGKVLRKYFDEKHIVIFDADSNIHHFKKPVTANDFLNHVYPDYKDRKIKLRINGRESHLDQALKDGDLVAPELI